MTAARGPESGPVPPVGPRERPGHRAEDTLPPAVRAAVGAATPARLFHGGTPLAYPTRDWLALRSDHAAARDALRSRIDLSDSDLASFVSRHRPVEVSSAATSLGEHLARPDLGRRLAPDSRRRLTAAREVDQPAVPTPDPRLGLVVGDGLSALAANRYAPDLVDALVEGAAARGWVTGTPIVVHRCRVGILNELGPLLDADVVILLIGERPGLAVADSLSAYLAYRPRPGDTDAQRNLISGIHDRGTPVTAAAPRALALAALLLAERRSGVTVKETVGDSPRQVRPASGHPEAAPG